MEEISMKKRLSTIVMILSIFLLQAQPVLASEPDSYLLKTSSYTFTDDYDPISIPSYLINGDVYVPLRAFTDIYDVMVEFDNTAKRIDMAMGVPEGKEKRLQILSEFVKDTQRKVSPTPYKLYFKGEEIDFPMLLVDGYNFVQIDILAEGFGLRAVRNGESTIALTSDRLFGSPYLPKFEAYMKENCIPVNTSDMSILPDAALDSYKVYLVGEDHATAKNLDIHLYFIKYLNQHQNVRFIIFEDGFCNTMMLNRYLKTGDDAIITASVEGSKGSPAYSKNWYDFYKELYEYNKTLPEDSKLFIVGLDVQHDAAGGIDYLLTLFDRSNEMPESVAAARAALEKGSRLDVLAAVKLLEENQADFAAYFGDGLEGIDAFHYGLRSLEQAIKFYEEEDYALRESFIHENFHNYYKTYGMDKTFGMFGSAHVFLDGTFDDVGNMASYMNNEYEPTKGKVCSIVTEYIDSFSMDAYTGEAVPLDYSQIPSLRRIMNQSTDKDMTLFPLNRNGSPFIESGVTDELQYYLFVKNSPAATPFGEMSVNSGD